MDVNCEGCAGCCLDWRPLADVDDIERRGPERALDDVFQFVALTRDDVRGLLDAGLADAMTPRLWEVVPEEPNVDIDGRHVAAIQGRPAFYMGIQKPPKPVGPFGTEPTWLRTCSFLDPTTLQCRLHDTDHYPQTCADYPAHNLKLGVRTMCENVEASFGGERLLDDVPPDEIPGLLLGPQAVGQKVFAYPGVAELQGVVDRIVAGEITREDRAKFVAAAAASAPGTTSINADRFDAAFETAMAAESWVGDAVADWERRAERDAPDPAAAREVEEDRGAPGTPGWNA